MAEVAANRPRAHIIYLVHRTGLGPVFLSQAVTLLSKLAQAGYSIDLGVFTPMGEFIRPRARERWRTLQGDVRTVFGGRLSRLPSAPSRARWLWKDAVVLAEWLRRVYPKEGAAILHCRNVVTTQLALDVRRFFPPAHVVYDCRGLASFEHLAMHTPEGADPAPDVRREADELLEAERRALRESDAMLCVSHAMKQYFVDTFDADPSKITVVPCCADYPRYEAASTGREAMRRELGLQDRFVVTYCGSMFAWQLPETCARVFAMIRERVPTAHYLLLTTQPETMRALLTQAGIREENTTVISVGHRQIADYLAAADVGLLIRADSPVNRVASPVKYAEYMASGVPVIMTSGIGDLSDLAEKERLGVVLPAGSPPDAWAQALGDFLEAFQKEPEAFRNRCRKIARERLAWNAHLPKLTALYDDLAQQDAPASDRAVRPSPGMPSPLPVPVYYIRYRYPHHSHGMGGDAMADYMGEVVEPSTTMALLGESLLRVPAKLTSLWCGSFEYSRHDAIRELNAAMHMRRHQRSIYHFLYGEKSYLFSGRLNGLRGNALMGTFHHPPSHYPWLFRSARHLRRLAFATCVSSIQVPFLEGLVGKDKVRFVPLGIDPDLFEPAQAPDDGPPYFLFAGMHMRDYATLGRIIARVLSAHSTVEFHLVTWRKRCRDILALGDRIHLHENIPDSAYRQLVRNARALVLPLTESTFVNAVLESLSSGVPVITNRGGVSDYLDADCSLQFPVGDADGMANAVLDLLHDEDRRRAMARSARARALEFAWPKVAEQMVAVYEELARRM